MDRLAAPLTVHLCDVCGELEFADAFGKVVHGGRWVDACGPCLDRSRGSVML